MEKEKNQQSTTKNIQELEEYWDGFSLSYTEKFSKSLSALYISMITMMNIEKADCILETAVGPGILIPHLIQRVKSGAKIHLTDLSTDFLAYTQKRLEQLSENQGQNLYSIDKSELKPFEGPIELKNFNITLQKANSEDLNMFQDNSVDAYISSLCLQITENPQQMVSEAFRVLRPGGKACLSVWGSKENSQLMTIVPSVLRKNNIQLPNERSNFHLGDREKLIQMFEKEGFTNILCWNQFLPVNMIMNQQDVEAYMNIPRNQNFLQQVSEQEKEKIKHQVVSEFQVLFDNKMPNGLDTMVILVTKPDTK